MRTFRSVAASLLLVAVWAGGAQAQDEILALFPKLATPPEIDGVADPIWDEVDGYGNDDFVELGGELEDDSDLVVTWKGAWDDDNLYVWAHIADDEIINDETFSWEDDSFEIYIDAQNTDEPLYTPDNAPEIPAYQFTIIAGDEPLDGTSAFTHGTNSYAGDDEITQYPQGADSSVSFWDEDNSSYTVEVAFPWEALEETPENILARGDEGFGFGIAVNDDDDGGGRDVQLMWGTESGELWRNAEVFPSVGLSTEVVGGGGGVDGDFDDDGDLDADDIDALTAAIGTDNAAYDLDGDGTVTAADHNAWVVDEKMTWLGDANLDGEFGSADLVAAFTVGRYETGEAAGWAAGDWDGDGLFSSADFVAAFSQGGYENGPRAAAAAVPEPSAILLIGLGLLGLASRRRN